jgi:Trypsin
MAVTLAGVASVSVMTADAAQAAGVTDVTDSALSFGVKVSVGDTAACSGALVTPWWFVTAKSCFADASGTVPTGVPPVATTAVVGRLDLTTTAGYELGVDRLVPDPDRDLIAARLTAPAYGVPTVPVATSAPAVGAAVSVLGYGRTHDTWVPDRMHSGDFTVTAVNAGTLEISPAADATVCRGDAGGPALVQGGSGPQLIGVHATSGQGGCLGSTATPTSAIETRLDDLGTWITANTKAPASQALALTGARIGLLAGDYSTRSKDNGLSTAWTTLLPDAKQIVVSGSRIGVLTHDGTAWVKDTATSTTFVKENVGVAQLALSPNRVGILTTAGTVLVKEGGLSTSWVTMSSNAKQVAVTDTRVAVLTNAGAALAKDGTLSATTTWTTEFTGVTQLALAAQRIGIVETNGTALVKDGGLSASWVSQATSGVASIVLDGDRVGVLTTGNVAKVKDGALTAAFVTEHTDVRQLSLGADRIGVVRFDGTALVKDGGLSALWTQEWP